MYHYFLYKKKTIVRKIARKIAGVTCPVGRPCDRRRLKSATIGDSKSQVWQGLYRVNLIRNKKSVAVNGLVVRVHIIIRASFTFIINESATFEALSPLPCFSSELMAFFSPFYRTCWCSAAGLKVWTSVCFYRCDITVHVDVY